MKKAELSAEEQLFGTAQTTEIATAEANAFELIQNLSNSDFVDLTSNWLDLESWNEGEEKDFIFSHIGEKEDERGQPKKVVFLRGRNGIEYATSATVFVSVAESGKIPLPFIARCTFKGLRISKTGMKYRDFQILGTPLK